MNLKAYAGHKRVCIIGHKGYIGSTLYNVLKSSDVHVTIFNDLNINSCRDVEEVFLPSTRRGAQKFDVIFWLASADLSSIPSNMKEKDIDSLIRERGVNCDSLLYLYKALKGQTPTIVFTSSTNVYGDIPHQIVSEDTIENPQTLWQAHKILSENYINTLFPNSICLRIPNIYGIIPYRSKQLYNKSNPYPFGKLPGKWEDEGISVDEQLLNTNTYFRPVVNKIIRLGIEDEKLTLYKNKLCFRDYLHIYDLINALVFAGLQKSTEKRYYTLGCGSRSTIEDVWKIISEYLGGIPIEYNDKALSDMETRSFTSDYTKFKDLTGWNPKYTLRFGIKESIEQIKKVLNDSTF